ncbi:MAG: PepSY domain-containing protein, partial [Vicinamibacterales bacterium]
MTPLVPAARRLAIVVHRWMGVALSILLTAWCLSGIVLMYRGYPEITDRDRLARLSRLEAARVRVSAVDAARTGQWTGAPEHARLLTVDGRPAWEFGSGRDAAVVFADDGSLRAPADDASVSRAAEAWAGRPAVDAARTSITEADQWTLQSGLRTLRPLYLYAWPDGQHVYVDGVTAQVVQFTTTASRAWAWAGAIPHWLYFTPLRVRTSLWSQVVIWTSGAGAVTTLLGIVVTLLIVSWQKRYRVNGAARRLPYRGWGRWHAIGGTAFGVLVITWAFSGLLSMGPFESIDRLTGKHARADEAQRNRRALQATLLGGGEPSLDAYVRPPADALAALGGFDVRRLDLGWFSGRPHYRAVDGNGGTRIVPMAGPAVDGLGSTAVTQVVRSGASTATADTDVQTGFDAYYLDRRGERPLPVVRVVFAGTGHPRFYVDPRTARIVGAYHEGQWVERWLYSGLHSWNLPWLYAHRPLWDVLVIAALLGAT